MTSGSGNDPNPDTEGGHATSTSQPGQPAGGTTNPYPYPYPAANSYPYPAAYYNPNQPGAVVYYGPAYGIPVPARRYTPLRWLCIIAVAAILLYGASALILSLILRPRLPEFSVSSATVSSFNLSSQQLSSDFDLTITILNRNEKLAIHYDRVEASMLYKSHVISDTLLAPFHQDVGNTTVLQAALVAVARYVNAEVVEGINADRAHGGGTVGFDMGLLASVRFTAGGWWRSGANLMRVFCEDVRIRFANAAVGSGSLVGPPRYCLVGLGL